MHEFHRFPSLSRMFCKEKLHFDGKVPHEETNVKGNQ